MLITAIFSTLVHGRKPFKNITNSIISDVVRGQIKSWNIINKTQISFKSITEKKSLKNVNNNNKNKTKKANIHKKQPLSPPSSHCFKRCFYLMFKS